MDDLKNKILKLKNEYGENRPQFSLFVEREHSDIIDEINSVLPQLKEYKSTTKIYWILNGIVDFPKCSNPNCNNKVGIGMEVNSLKKFKYPKYCCHDCFSKSGAWMQALRKSMVDKYGEDNASKVKELKDKSNLTLISKYGSLENYHKCQRKLANNTLVDKYGVDNPMKCESILARMHTTMNEKYGHEHALQVKEFKDKASNTMLSNFGTNNVWLISNNRQRMLLKKVIRDKKRRWEQILSDRECIPLFGFEEFDLVFQNDGTTLKWHCNKCGSDFEGEMSKYFFHLKHHFGRCPKCYPMVYDGTSSTKESEIKEFIQTLSINIVTNDRNVLTPDENNNWKSNHELDIYIPDRKLALEFDGLYWHSDDNTRHLFKTECCMRKGIQLIHIFENEWDFKKEIVKSRIKNLLGIYDKVVYARKCEVRIVSSKESFEFQCQNHIQGGVHSSVNLGLYYGDELVSLMTFSKPRFNKKYEWELVRFCNKLGYHIPGGASRLLKHFERNHHPKSVVSYADLRWSQGKLYEKLEFDFDHRSEPNYWYWKNSEFYHRSKCQKHKLKSMLENLDKTKSKVQNMYDNGYRRIFDCGNLVYVKKYN